MAAYNKFNAFVGYMSQGKMNSGSDSYKVMLTNTAPVSTNSVYADVSGAELANGNGYTTGGAAVGTISDTNTTGTVKFIASADNVFTCVTAPMGPFRYTILVDITPAGTPTKPLVGWWDYGSSITLQIGETFTVDWDQTNGIWQLA